MPEKLLTIDVTSGDMDDLARMWGVECATTRNGLQVLAVKEPSFINGIHGREYGAENDMLVNHNQKLERHFVNKRLFSFLFDPK